MKPGNESIEYNKTTGEVTIYDINGTLTYLNDDRIVGWGILKGDDEADRLKHFKAYRRDLSFEEHFDKYTYYNYYNSHKQTIVFDEKTITGKNPSQRAETSTAGNPRQNEQNNISETTDKTQSQRSESIAPDDNTSIREENTKPEVMGDESSSPKERVETNKPVTEADKQESEYGGGTLLEDIEHWIPTLFEPARKGIASLKSELERDVNENNWVGKAIGASFLDVLDTTMTFAEGIPLGLLDTRRIGEGIAEGTYEGVKKDLSRAFNVLPQGKALRAIDRAITASNIIEGVGKQDYKEAALSAGMGVLGSRAGKFTIGTSPKGLLFNKPTARKRQIWHNKQSWRDSEIDTGNFLKENFNNGEWKPQTKFKNGDIIEGTGRNPKDSTIPDWHNEKIQVAVESKRYSDVLSKIDKEKILSQVGGRHISLKKGTKQWLVVDHRGQNLSEISAAAIHSNYFKSFGGTSVFEKIFIVTEKGIYTF